MGTLVNCKTCGAAVSSYAKVCPQCGEVNPVDSKGCFTAMLIVSFLFAIFAVSCIPK